MGKNNFNSYEDVCRRLTELEKLCTELKEENRMLKSCRNLGHERTIKRDIQHRDMLKRLFAIAPTDDGAIIANEEAERANFSVFYQNIYRALEPTVREHKGKYSLKMRNISDLSEEEYKIYLDTLDSCIEIIYYAKRKLQDLQATEQEGLKNVYTNRQYDF